MKPTNQNNMQKAKEILKIILIIVSVIVIGVFAVNQVLKFFYYSQLLQSPCELCAKLNQEQAECIKSCFIIRDVPPIPNINPYNISIPFPIR